MRLAARGLLAALCVWLLAAAAAASSVELRADPRVELLGVVQYLAGKRPPRAPAPPAALELEAAFGAWRGHPAVRTYAAAYDRLDGAEPFVLLVLAASPPPELALLKSASSLPGGMLKDVGGEAGLRRFLLQLGDFARKTGFARYYAAHRDAFERSEAAARESVGSGEAELRLVEGYVGRDLESRVRLIPSVLYVCGRYTSYIIPYPYRGPGQTAPGPYDVYSILRGDEAPGSLRSGTWNELLYVEIERGFALHGAAVEKLGSPPGGMGSCPGAWGTCARHLLVTSLKARLALTRLEAWSWPDDPSGRYGRALEARLVEYEKGRDRHATLQDFFPRWLETFAELSPAAKDGR